MQNKVTSLKFSINLVVFIGVSFLMIGCFLFLAAKLLNTDVLSLQSAMLNFFREYSLLFFVLRAFLVWIYCFVYLPNKVYEQLRQHNPLISKEAIEKQCKPLRQQIISIYFLNEVLLAFWG